MRSSGDGGEEQEAKEKIEDGLRRTFRPEFLNRIDEIIIFHTLTLEHMGQIVDLQMKEIRERLEERGEGSRVPETKDGRCRWIPRTGHVAAFLPPLSWVGSDFRLGGLN